jgi:hypothetical protein
LSLDVQLVELLVPNLLLPLLGMLNLLSDLKLLLVAINSFIFESLLACFVGFSLPHQRSHLVTEVCSADRALNLFEKPHRNALWVE